MRKPEPTAPDSEAPSLLNGLRLQMRIMAKKHTEEVKELKAELSQARATIERLTAELMITDWPW